MTVLGRLAQQVAAVADRADGGIDPSRQAEILKALDELEAQVTELPVHPARIDGLPHPAKRNHERLVRAHRHAQVAG